MTSPDPESPKTHAPDRYASDVFHCVEVHFSERISEFGRIGLLSCFYLFRSACSGKKNTYVPTKDTPVEQVIVTEKTNILLRSVSIQISSHGLAASMVAAFCGLRCVNPPTGIPAVTHTQT